MGTTSAETSVFTRKDLKLPQMYKRNENL